MGWSPSVPSRGKPTLDQPGLPTGSPVPVRLVSVIARRQLPRSISVFVACCSPGGQLRRANPLPFDSGVFRRLIPGTFLTISSERGVGIVKTIGLEEHFFTANVVQAWSRLEPQWQNPPGLNARDDLAHRLTDLDTDRFAAMEDSGLDVQVLSLTSPGVQNLVAGDAVALQTECNDLVA